MSWPTVHAKARVQITIEMDAGGGKWSSDTPVSQIHKQAIEDVLNELKSKREFGPARGFKIIGEPNVTAILVVEDRR